MIKKLCILLLSVCTVAPLMAQQYSSGDNASFAPQKGQWQASFVLGHGNFYDEANIQTLLPTYTGSQTDPIGVNNNLGYYLNLGSMNYNSLVNIAGIQGKYFITDRIDINLMFSMNINITPKKDYIEGDNTVPDMNIPEYKSLDAKMTNNWLLNIGSDYYFRTRNARINPYLGGVAGFQMGRIEVTKPYTGDVVIDPNGDDVDQQIFVPAGRAGQVYGFSVSAVAGIEYSLTEGLVLGLEVQPVSYRYNLLQVCPKGLPKYSACNHDVKFIASPVLKLGIRF